MALLQKQEAIFAEPGDRAGLQRGYCNQAVILWQQGRKEEAREKMRAARDGLAKLGMVRDRDLVQENLERMRG